MEILLTTFLPKTSLIFKGLSTAGLERKHFKLALNPVIDFDLINSGVSLLSH